MVVSALGFYQISCLDRIPQRLCCACRALTPFNPFETSEEPSNQVEGEKQMEDEEQRSPPESELTMERESLGMGRNRLPSDNDNLSKVEISYSSGLRLT